MMTKRERVRAALAGAPVDRVPVSFWRHWPVDDQDAEAQAQRTLEFQQRFDWDFIKVTPSSSYSVHDWGAAHAYRGWAIGDRDYLERVVKNPEDWDRIEPVDVSKGAYGRQLACLRRVLELRDPETPVIQTIFNPIRMAGYLAGDEALAVHLHQHPEKVERALGVLTEVCAAFVRAVVGAGADGVFISTSAASFEMMSVEDYRRFGRSGDMAVLEAAKGSWFNIMHLHGQHPMYQMVSDYPVQALNWHDRTSWPDLAEGAKLFPGAVVGGIEQYDLLHFATPAEVEAQAHDAIRRMGGRRMILAAGCTFPLTVPEGNLHAARWSVDSYKP